MVVCYMVISPNPHMQSRLSHEENNLATSQYINVQTYGAILEAKQPGKWLEWIHIKVTAGMKIVRSPFVAFYPPHVPSFCQLTKQKSLPSFNVNGIADAQTEWHELKVKVETEENCEELQKRLIAMLDLFGRWNRWEELGTVHESTSKVENLVDAAWHCDSEEAIAKFVK
ncbi:hypothetical protein BKA64DRAFT_726470 [Cadophora sp. MPI-SDFR-AT-0126]|nr:hypothetical protein BKA64DRAFT_726470 [Leotiomycetes sp. MPI-SDFR-AT-0126]